MRADHYEILAQRGKDWARLVANLRRIEAAIASIPFEPFFEPVAQLVSRDLDNPATLAAITASLLGAWTRHVAYGTIVRLGGLTGPCLNLLGENQLIVRGLVERAILEHAGHGERGPEKRRPPDNLARGRGILCQFVRTGASAAHRRRRGQHR